MTPTLFWQGVAVFVLGLFVGSNLGVALLCVLQVAGRSSDAERAREAK